MIRVKWFLTLERTLASGGSLIRQSIAGRHAPSGETSQLKLRGQLCRNNVGPRRFATDLLNGSETSLVKMCCWGIS